jgi:hypothetical protein
VRAAACLLLSLAATPAAADTVRCADAKGEATAEFDITFADETRRAGDVTRVDARFEDFTVSTDPTDPDQRPDILDPSDQVTEDDRLEIFLLDPDNIRYVLALRLFRAFKYDGTDKEYEEHVVAGTLSAMAAGVWAVTCTGW